MTNMSPQRPLSCHFELWYRCREKWTLSEDNILPTATATVGMYTLSYTLSATAYSDPGDSEQIAEEIRLRFVYTTADGSYTSDYLFDYAEA